MELRELCKGKRVLVLEGYCKQCLPFIRGFKDLGCHVSVLCNSKLDCGYASRLPDSKILGVCDLSKPKETEEYIVNLIKKGNYDLAFPAFEFSARILSHNREKLSKYAIIYSNDADIFDRANDKNEVMRVCMENDIPCPHTLFGVTKPEDVSAKGLQYPIIIKPRRSYGGRGFHPFDTESDLKSYVDANNINLEDYVVQERIPADRIGLSCNAFVDRNGDVKSCFSYVCKHMYPEVGGTSTLNALIDRPDVKETCAKLLKKMNVRGVVGVDIMVDSRDNIGKVIEINVRPAHAITIGFLSGFDLCRQILEDAFNLPVTEFNTVRTDFCVRIGQTDMLWFLSSPDRFKKSPRRMGYKKVYEQMFYWDDPMPWFAFLISGLKDFRKKMKEKKQ